MWIVPVSSQHLRRTMDEGHQYVLHGVEITLYLNPPASYSYPAGISAPPFCAAHIHFPRLVNPSYQVHVSLGVIRSE